MSSVTPLNPNVPSLPERWAACSVGRDGARHVQTNEALALARAVEISLARNRVTAELDACGTGVGGSSSKPVCCRVGRGVTARSRDFTARSHTSARGPATACGHGDRQ